MPATSAMFPERYPNNGGKGNEKNEFGKKMQVFF
jgi:hypothetical protein